MVMKRMTGATLAAFVLAGAASASAQSGDAPGYRADTPEVVARGPDGRATEVRIDGVVYPVCAGEDEDGCIQPRAARLGWGDRPLQRWPGEAGGRNEGSARTEAPAGQPGT